MSLHISVAILELYINGITPHSILYLTSFIMFLKFMPIVVSVSHSFLFFLSGIPMYGYARNTIICCWTCGMYPAFSIYEQKCLPMGHPVQVIVRTYYFISLEERLRSGSNGL